MDHYTISIFDTSIDEVTCSSKVIKNLNTEIVCDGDSHVIMSFRETVAQTVCYVHDALDIVPGEKCSVARGNTVTEIEVRNDLDYERIFFIIHMLVNFASAHCMR